MHRIPSSFIGSSMAILGLGFSHLHAQVVFSESFESAVVSGFASGTVPDNGNWIGASNGFGSGNRGLYNETVAWPATPDFTTPYGDQAYYLNYTNSALTTAVGATGQTVTADATYTVTFNTAITGSSGTYNVELVAFEAGDDNGARTNGQSSRPGTVLASATGPVEANDMSTSASVSFTPDGTNAHLGKDLGIRLVKASNVVLYDNIRLILGHDLNPSPADGEDLDVGGNVTLSWTNYSPNAPATDTPVDVWFGSDAGSLTQVVDGQIISSTLVSAPTADTWYWRVDSYLDGDPNGTPVTGQMFLFTIADTDGDGFPDDYELANTSPSSNTGLNPGDDLENGGAGDGLTNFEEFQYGTDPNNPDSDGDNLEDGAEINGTAGLRPVTSPLLADTDDDGLDDDVESNTGTWVDSSDSGTNPVLVDTDGDGLLDGAETNTGILVDRFNAGTDPHDKDSDEDGVWDWYEVAAALTSPHDDQEKPDVPYPLPDPLPTEMGATDKPVKVYILSGQSNMVGYGQISGSSRGTLNTMTRTENKFPNLIDANGDFLARQDVMYRGVISATGKAPLAPGFGRNSNSIGPELGFGQIMGWYHDEPVLVIKASIGNRGLQWDFLPPGSQQFDFTNGKTYPGYGESPRSWTTGTTPVPVGWYAGKEFDRFFAHKDDWAPAGASSPQDPNVATVLDNWATEYPDWAAQGFEIAGFGWFHGFDDSNGTTGPEAGRYEQNMVQLIKELRNYYENRYPGKVVPNAPFAATTFIVGGPNRTPRALEVADALLAVSGDAGNYPEFVGNVKTMEAVEYWRNADESPGTDTIHHRWNAETFMLIGDALGRAMLGMQNDATPPFPDPMTFSIEPTAVDPTRIGMVATTATDPSGPVEYWFENIDAATNSGWITDTRWNSIGLTNGTSYNFRVKARDAEGNEGAWSTTVSASPGSDIAAPTPDPMSFASVPTAQGENTVTMTATMASDINDVEYEFVNTAGGGNSSGWQDSPIYTDSGLNPGTEYIYQVRSRDKSSGQNATAFSSMASATTEAPDTTAPTPDPMTFASPPTATGETTITMTADAATDPSGVEYRFNNVTLATDSGWQDSPSYEAIGLSPATEYVFTVQARDKSSAQTATSASGPASATTDAPDTTAPQVTLLSPANGATGVPIDSDLEVTFDENIAIGTGLITIKNLSDATESTISITDAGQVSVSGAVLVINPTASLLDNTDYAVQFAETAIDDLAGNSFLGVSDDVTWSFSTPAPPQAGLLFTEDFESPDVAANAGDGDTNKTLPDNGNWVGATQGFGSNRRGITDKAGGDFSAAAPNEQAFAFRYTNSGLTTAEGVISTLTAGVIYTVSFDVVRDDGGNAGRPYTAQLIAFGSGAARNDCRSTPSGSEVLTSTNGNAPEDGSFARVTFNFTADAVDDAASLGKDLGVRFIGATTTAIIDNVEVSSVGPGGPGPVDHFAISAIPSPQTVGNPITGITITAQDASDATATGFTGTVTFGGTGGFTGTSASFTAGVLTGVSVTPTVAGTDLTLTVDDGAGHTGSATIGTIQSAYESWSGGEGFELDSNADGVPNGMAWVLGAANPSADARGLLPTFDNSNDADYFIFSYNRSDVANDDLGTTITVEYGSGLTGWTPAVDDGDNVLITEAPGSPTDAVEVKLKRSTLEADGKMFIRLNAVTAP